HTRLVSDWSSDVCSSDLEQAYTSFDDYWGPFLKGAGPGGAYVVSLGDERRSQLEARMRKRLLGNRDDGAFVLKAQAWCVRGEAQIGRASCRERVERSVGG